MPLYKPGDVVLIAFPFTHLKKTKKRPALVLLNVGDNDVIVARITSKLTHTNFDVVIREWENAGLISVSIVRIHKLGTIEESVIEKKIGVLDKKDWMNVCATARMLFREMEK
ncbi:MAG: type II toxin-antitoxin system PemK/MazF family toxin [Candidatus Uhrbacteria bacterium]|nr:type II toxin-antitoxin system PemK/MazF family toxin [Candidatus Uhrbacteria bacterium]